jgi:hypothetical protein
MAGGLPFIGRRDELRALKTWFADAAGGAARIVLLEGEPGIGKSALVDRFVADALRRRQPPTVLRSTCYQGVHVPYLPLATALQPIGDLASLLQPLREDTPERSDERRLHLYTGVVDVITRAASHAPLLVVIDDAQWADQGTLDLLSHVLQVTTQSTIGQPIMTLLPHRTTVDGAFAELLERLRRAPSTRRLSLGGLDTFALHELVEAVTGQRPSRKLLDGLGEASAGNPLLAKSLLERLEAFGVLTVRSGHVTYRGSEELLAGPAELDELLRHRLRDLPRACLDLLVAAAFVGEGASLEHVRAVMASPPERFHAIVEQAVTARVLLDHEVVRFDHPQVRQVMYQRPRGARRQRLHLDVANHLESLGVDDPERAVAVAHHLRRAGDLVEPSRVIQASVRAASHAATVVAWGEAARAYDAAIDAATESGDGASAFVALLHTRSAYAHWYNHDNPGAEQRALAAAAIAKRLGDLSLWADALDTLAHARWSSVAATTDVATTVAEFDDFLDTVGERSPALRSRVHRLRATLLLQVHNDVALARADMALAAELVDRDDPNAASDVAFAGAALALTELDLDRAVEHLDHAHARVIEAGNNLLRVSILRGRAMATWARGELEVAASTATEAIERALPIAAWAECAVTMSVAAGVAVASGRHDDCEELAVDAERLMRWSGFPLAPQILYPALACSRATRGDFDGALTALDQWARTGTRGFNRFRPLVDALAGRLEDVPPMRARAVPDDLTSLHLSALATAVEIGDLTDDMDRIRWAADGITELAARGVRFDMGWCFFVPRLAAVANARLGRRDTAEHWFDVAAADAARAGAPDEVARVELDRARLLPPW